ncbi:MAG: Coenzyme F420 hydrogenase/dehydrogenase, beta subunit C-terminal domain [Candidatus Freyarchaeota archaeon]|nr:Coenzyme F420 hydrogenase/dehydrogenase, beta subunit C-terminal domain [Candidatus Jordarchaeia archaeon]
MMKPLSWNKLCSGCGTCVIFCPKGIEMVLDPRSNYTPILKNECSFCDVCNTVCPTSDIIGGVTSKRNYNELIGRYVNSYIGYSKRRDIRWRASSGGLVTALLMFMLESNIIDGVLAVRMEGLRPVPFIAGSSKELLMAMGSKYLPVPLNAKLRNLLDIEGRFAVVGLPCHIRGVKKAMSVSRKLQEHILLSVGLFCSRTVSSIGIRTLLHKLRMREDVVEEISFRGRGWPGKLYVRLRNGDEVFFPYFSYWRPLFSTHFFTPTSCMFCSDLTNEEADISAGDPWLPEILGTDRLGTSIAVSRTEIGDEILREAWRAGYIELKEIGIEKVVESQWRPLFFKKVTLPARQILTKRVRECASPVSPLQLITALIQLANKGFSETSVGQYVIERLHFKILEAYAFVLSRVEKVAWVMYQRRRQIESSYNQ